MVPIIWQIGYSVINVVVGIFHPLQKTWGQGIVKLSSFLYMFILIYIMMDEKQKAVATNLGSHCQGEQVPALLPLDHIGVFWAWGSGSSMPGLAEPHDSFDGHLLHGGNVWPLRGMTLGGGQANVGLWLNLRSLCSMGKWCCFHHATLQHFHSIQ